MSKLQLLRPAGKQPAAAQPQPERPQVPLLERLRFMCISCTNLDEFFEIRAAAVRHAQEFGLPPAPAGMSPTWTPTATSPRTPPSSPAS